MRALSDIFYHSTVKREVLFEDGDWCIYRRADLHNEQSQSNGIYVIHRCESSVGAVNHKTWLCGSVSKGSGTGLKCTELAPEGIQGLYILVQWKP